MTQRTIIALYIFNLFIYGMQLHNISKFTSKTVSAAIV